MQQPLTELSKDQLVQLVLNERNQQSKILSQRDKIQEKLEAEYIKAQTSYEREKARSEQLQQWIDKLKRMLFGPKKERFVKEQNPNQINLPFEELEAKNEASVDEPVKKTITYTRTQSNHKGRNRLPDDLPVREVVIEPVENTEGMVKIGEERTEILELAPAKFFKLVLVRPKYVKPHDEDAGVLIGELPSRPIDRCMAGNALLSSILINKYVDHLPLYRQQQIFKRWGIRIAPSTIDHWVARLGALLEPLYQSMVNVVKHDGYLQVDETPTRVIDRKKKGKCHRGYYWVYHSPPKRMVVFDYKRGRGQEAPREMLNDFKGYLQTDGYKVYAKYGLKEGITHLACWAHARRYFEHALDQDRARAAYAMTEIQKLYAIERRAKDMEPEERKALRLEESLPVINALGKWIVNENKKVLPRSLIGKAFNYTIMLWDSLQNYLYNGELLIDNNLIENTIRPNALGRKNYLFAGSDEGARRTAMFYTFTGTCKLHGVEPMTWLTAVLSKIADHHVNKLYQLFPQNMELTENLPVIKLTDK